MTHEYEILIAGIFSGVYITLVIVSGILIRHKKPPRDEAER